MIQIPNKLNFWRVSEKTFVVNYNLQQKIN